LPVLEGSNRMTSACASDKAVPTKATTISSVSVFFRNRFSWIRVSVNARGTHNLSNYYDAFR